MRALGALVLLRKNAVHNIFNTEAGSKLLAQPAATSSPLR